MDKQKRSLLCAALMLTVVIAAACGAVKPAPPSMEVTAENQDPTGWCRVIDYGRFDPQRVDVFVGDFMSPTVPWYLFWTSTLETRTHELDNRIRSAPLTLADKIEVFKRLSPRRDPTFERKELRMERLVLSIAPTELALFKLALEYDGDYKDLEEYLFHDIDTIDYRNRILEHFRKAPRQNGVKVLSDVDDTLYANLLDSSRYPVKTVYPGVLEFYDALKHEPFAVKPTPVTLLSARPNPIAGDLEEASLRSLIRLTKGQLCPSALSGNVVSSVLGTLETVLRNKLDDPLHDYFANGNEQEIARVKFQNFVKFSEVYPEYRYVFVGDSGQADALTAQLMLSDRSAESTARVVTTFIHDITKPSPAFNLLPAEIIVKKTSANGRGVIVFRNYIEAAVIAHMHSETLGDLITAEELAKITHEALTQFQAIKFTADEPTVTRLRNEYRQDAEEAYKLLITGAQKSSADVSAIRTILDQGF